MCLAIRAVLSCGTATVEKLQVQIDALSEQSQLEMPKLQSMMCKRQAAVDRAQTPADSGDTKDDITGPISQ